MNTHPSLVSSFDPFNFYQSPDTPTKRQKEEPFTIERFDNDAKKAISQTRKYALSGLSALTTSLLAYPQAAFADYTDYDKDAGRNIVRFLGLAGDSFDQLEDRAQIARLVVIVFFFGYVYPKMNSWGKSDSKYEKITENVDEEKANKWKEFFDKVDLDKDGIVTKNELLEYYTRDEMKEMFEKKGQEPPDMETIEQGFKDLGLDIDGPGLNLQQFTDLKLYAKSKVAEIEKN